MVIFKKGSPANGMKRVKVYTDQGMPSDRGIGMLARAPSWSTFPCVRLSRSLLEIEAVVRLVETVFIEIYQSAATEEPTGLQCLFRLRHV